MLKNEKQFILFLVIAVFLGMIAFNHSPEKVKAAPQTFATN